MMYCGFALYYIELLYIVLLHKDCVLLILALSI